MRLSDARLYSDYAWFVEHFEETAARLPPGRSDRLLFHCFWSGTLTWHHELSLKSLLLTQSEPLEIWLWAPPETIAANEAFLDAMRGPSFRVQACVPDELMRGTPLEGHDELFAGKDAQFAGNSIEAAVSDAVRTLVMLRHGGIYFDLDMLFLADLRRLTGVEFIYPWSNQPFGNSALMHFRQASRNLSALAGHAAEVNSCHPRMMYWFDAIDPLVEELMVWPEFLFDPAWIAHDTRTPINDHCLSFKHFFRREAPPMSLATFYPGSYAYHWHNGWNCELIDASIAGQLYREVRSRWAYSEPGVRS
jgi:hypothetical protein